MHLATCRLTLLEAYLQVPLIGVLTGGLRPWYNSEPTRPLEGIRAAGRNAWLSTVFSLLISVAFGVALGVLEGGRAGGPDDKLYGGLTIGLLGAGPARRSSVPLSDCGSEGKICLPLAIIDLSSHRRVDC